MKQSTVTTATVSNDSPAKGSAPTSARTRWAASPAVRARSRGTQHRPARIHANDAQAPASEAHEQAAIATAGVEHAPPGPGLEHPQKLTTAMRRSPRTIRRDALAMMERYAWPGNVRELKNVIERAVILEEHAEILPDHFPDELKPGGRALDLKPGFRLPAGGIGLESLEKNLIRQALEQARGNKTRAAALQGLTRDTLRHRLEKHGIGEATGSAE